MLQDGSGRRKKKNPINKWINQEPDEGHVNIVRRFIYCIFIIIIVGIISFLLFILFSSAFSPHFFFLFFLSFLSSPLLFSSPSFVCFASPLAWTLGECIPLLGGEHRVQHRAFATFAKPEQYLSSVSAGFPLGELYHRSTWSPIVWWSKLAPC